MVVGAIFIDINKSFIDINKDGVGHITKRMLPTDAKELVHLYGQPFSHLILIY